MSGWLREYGCELALLVWALVVFVVLVCGSSS